MYRPLFIFLAFAMTCTATVARADNRTDYDTKSAVIFQYSAIEDEGNNTSAITSNQFSDHIQELKTEGYSVLPLPDIVSAFEKQKDLPPKTIALTFDGNDPSIIKIAAPILIENKIPFTLFIDAAAIKGEHQPMNWDSLRLLKATKLVTFGIQPTLDTDAPQTDEDNKRALNNALSAIRHNLDITPSLFAYPYGEYSARYVQTIKNAGIRSAFGIQGGVANPTSDPFAIPRFPMTEMFANLDRFVMAANALPLPVTDMTIETTMLDKPVGFTIVDELSDQIKKLNCIVAKTDKIETYVMDTRIELRIREFKGNDIRINCMMPVETEDEAIRWRWLGFLFTQPKTN